MPKIAKKLAELTVRNLKQDGRYMVGGAVGLHLRVAGESRSWILRVTLNDKRCDIGLGAYPGVTLSTARELANEIHNSIAKGIDPLAAKRARTEAVRIERAMSKTFEECAKLYVDAHKGDWKNEKHAKQWSATLETYAYPIIGKLPVASIDTALIQSVLGQPVTVGDDEKKLWEGRAETASRLRGRIESVLDSAKAAGLRHGENPARWDGHLKHLLGKRQRLTRGHHPALPYREIGSFMAAVRKRDGTAAKAVEFAILCGSRSGEVRGMTWDEIEDLDGTAPLWRIPASRMKAGEEHLVPLSAPAIALLKRLRAVRIVGTNFVFAAPRGGMLSDMTLTAVLRRMGHTNITMHGMRSALKDWASNETDFPDEVSEEALAHTVGSKVRRAYRREKAVEKQRDLLALWAAYCATASNVVVAIGEAA